MTVMDIICQSSQDLCLILQFESKIALMRVTPKNVKIKVKKCLYEINPMTVMDIRSQSSWDLYVTGQYESNSMTVMDIRSQSSWDLYVIGQYESNPIKVSDIRS